MSTRGVRGAWVALGLSVVLTLVLFYAPHGRTIGRPLVWLSTLAHELGHGMTALLVGARFEQLVLHVDASGYASWSGSPGRLGRAAIAAGGLIGPAVVAAACFVAARTATGARVALGAVSLFLAVVLVVWVRSLFGAVFVLGLVGVLGALAWKASAEVARLAVMFLGVQLGLSVFSRGDYLFMASATVGGREMPSDVSHIAEALLLPYWFWGALIGLASLAVIGGGLALGLHPGLGAPDASSDEAPSAGAR